MVLVKPGDIFPREGPGAGIYPERGAGLGLGSGAPRVQLSNSGQEPLCPWEVQGMRERCPNLPTPLAREAITLLLNVHKEGRNRQGNSLKSWAPGQF